MNAVTFICYNNELDNWSIHIWYKCQILHEELSRLTLATVLCQDPLMHLDLQFNLLFSLKHQSRFKGVNG